MQPNLIRLPKILSKTGLSKPTIYRLIKTASFPAPVPVTGVAVSVWLETEIDDWIALQIKNPRRLSPQGRLKQSQKPNC